MRIFRLAILITLLSAGFLFAQNKPAPKPTGPKVVLDTTAGTITCMLFPDKAPLTVATFIGLAEGTKDWVNPTSRATMHKKPLYNGTIFHRVIPGFMIQGGDPTGTGGGDPGFTIRDEITNLRFDRPGRLGMAHYRPNQNGSQFFITEAAAPQLDGRYTVFGQCDPASIPVVKKIARLPRDTTPGPRQDRPFDPATLNKVTIVRQPPAKTGGN